MPTTKKQLPLAGSDRSPMPGAREVGPTNPGEMIEVTVRLRSRAGQQPIVSPEVASQLPSQRPILSREDFEKMHGADPASIARVEKFARDHGLKVDETSAARRTVVLSGDVGAMSAAFGVELKEYE